MLSLTRPKFFLPVHGEHRMLVKHSQTAQSMGVPAENMVVIDNGDVVELTPTAIRIAGKVPSGVELVDTSRSGIVNDKVLKERQQLAGDGVVTIAATIDWEGQLLAQPQVHLRGVVTSLDRLALQAKVQDVIGFVLRDRWNDFARTFDSHLEVDWVGLQVQIEREIQRMLRRELQSNPLLVFLMQHSEEPVVKASSKGRRIEAIAS
jgi:ribonuclease J